MGEDSEGKRAWAAGFDLISIGEDIGNKRARAGNDGILVRDPYFVALERLSDGTPRLCGGAIVTLVLPGFAPCRGQMVADPENPVVRCVPHLDWGVFSRHGNKHSVATLLLENILDATPARGWSTLTGTFPFGKPQSMKWHWRNGVVLAARPRCID